MVFRLRVPLLAYRIADSRQTIFDGMGASLNGGRWNSPGHRVIYAALTYSGALLEMLAHTNIGKIPSTHASLTIHIPGNMKIEQVTAENVPGWSDPGQSASRACGDEWLRRSKTAVLIVPSVVSRKDCNILINQNHPDFRKIRADKPEPVVWDERLFKRQP